MQTAHHSALETKHADARPADRRRRRIGPLPDRDPGATLKKQKLRLKEEIDRALSAPVDARPRSHRAAARSGVSDQRLDDRRDRRASRRAAPACAPASDRSADRTRCPTRPSAHQATAPVDPADPAHLERRPASPIATGRSNSAISPPARQVAHAHVARFGVAGDAQPRRQEQAVARAAALAPIAADRHRSRRTRAKLVHQRSPVRP